MTETLREFFADTSLVSKVVFEVFYRSAPNEFQGPLKAF